MDRALPRCRPVSRLSRLRTRGGLAPRCRASQPAAGGGQPRPDGPRSQGLEKRSGDDLDRTARAFPCRRAVSWQDKTADFGKPSYVKTLKERQNVSQPGTNTMA